MMNARKSVEATMRKPPRVIPRRRGRGEQAGTAEVSAGAESQQGVAPISATPPLLLELEQVAV